MELDGAETHRYGRHLVLPEVGVGGQKRLKAARVLLVGAGGLGSPAALYLAAAGVGTLGLVEFDRVDRSNLQRQVLYGDSDVGRPKSEAAAERLRGLNPEIRVVPHATRLDRDNVLDLLEGYDLVVDGSDNATTRYLVNDACLIAGKPDVWGAVLRFEGQVSVFAAEGGPCYRCLFPEPPPPGTVPSCAEGGVLGVLPGIIGAMQANEAIKLILGIGKPLIARFVVFDALQFRFREVSLPRNPRCPGCGDGIDPILMQSPTAACEAVGGPTASEEDSAMVDGVQVPFEVDVHQLKAWRDQGQDHVLLDVREPQELEICRIDGSTVIPMREIPGRVQELEADRLLVVHCHHGGRSAQVVQFLRAQGFAQATNLAGGIEAWSMEIDPQVPRY